MITPLYMTGQALQWYHSLNLMGYTSAWEKFVKQLKIQFRQSTFVNHMAQLYKLKQYSIVKQYLSEFESLSTQISSLFHHNILNYFLQAFRIISSMSCIYLSPTTCTREWVQLTLLNISVIQRSLDAQHFHSHKRHLLHPLRVVIHYHHFLSKVCHQPKWQQGLRRPLFQL